MAGVSLPPDERGRASSEYLEAYFADETGWQDEVPKELHAWFQGLATHIARLRYDDPRLLEAYIYLEPFFNDDPLVDGYALYPEGNAIAYIEENWGGDHGAFLIGFVRALKSDYEDVIDELNLGGPIEFPGYDWLVANGRCEEVLMQLQQRPPIADLDEREARQQLELLEVVAARVESEKSIVLMRAAGGSAWREEADRLRSLALHRAGDVAARLGEKRRAADLWRAAATLDPSLAIKQRLRRVGEPVPDRYDAGLFIESDACTVTELYRARPKTPVSVTASGADGGTLVGLAGGKVTPNLLYFSDFNQARGWSRSLPPLLQARPCEEGVYVVCHAGTVVNGESQLHLFDYSDGRSIASQTYPTKTGRLLVSDRIVLVSGRDAVLRAYFRHTLEPVWTYTVPQLPIDDEQGDDLEDFEQDGPGIGFPYASDLELSPNGQWITFADWQRVFLMDTEGKLHWDGSVDGWRHGGPIVTNDGRCIVASGDIVFAKETVESGSIVTFDSHGTVISKVSGVNDYCNLVLLDDQDVLMVGDGPPRLLSGRALPATLKGTYRANCIRSGKRLCLWDNRGLDVWDGTDGPVWSFRSTESVRSAAFVDDNRLLVGGGRLWQVLLPTSEEIRG